MTTQASKNSDYDYRDALRRLIEQLEIRLCTVYANRRNFRAEIESLRRKEALLLELEAMDAEKYLVR